MKRIRIVLWLLLTGVSGLYADAYSDSLSAVLKYGMEEVPSFLNEFNQSDSMSVLLDEYFHSDVGREKLSAILDPFARKHVSLQNLHILLQYYRSGNTAQPDIAYLAAKEQLDLAEKELVNDHMNIFRFVMLSGFVYYLKYHYPHQADRLNKQVDSLAIVDHTTEQPSSKEKKEPSRTNEEVTYSPQKLSHKEGDKLYFYFRQETVPTPEDGDYIYHVPTKDDANCIGEVRRITDNEVMNVVIYERKKDSSAKGRLLAVRNYDSHYNMIGRQVDYYPSAKAKRVFHCNTSHQVISVSETDTLGNIVKTIEGSGNARKEKQYHTNGQLRKEKLGPGPKYDIHCFDKNGNPVRYLEGDLYVFDDGVYVISGNPPSYPGGTKAVIDYAKKHINLDGMALSNGYYELKCSIRIADDGSVDDVRINKSSGVPALDAEAVRVLMQMPKWTPGKLKKWKFVQNPQDAKVNVIRKRFVIPISITK